MCIFFQVEPPVAVGAGVWGIAAIDIGADGIADFVVADQASNKVTLLTSDGHGGISSETSFTVGKGPEGIAVGQFNSDGQPDVVVADAAGNAVSVLMNNGSGGFKPAVTIAVGKDPTSVATAALNGGTVSDIIVADSGSNAVTVLTSNGAATPKFSSATYAVGKAPDSVVTANLVPGARPDLITADGGAGEISVLINNGHGGFAKAKNYAVGESASSDPMAVTTADLNGDNVPDVIVANGDGSVSVLLNSGNGSLQPAQTFQVGFDLTAIATATLDNTGTPDILVADSVTDSIYVLAYQNGALVNLDTLNFPAAVVSMAVADVNNDGRPDIVATLANGDVQVVLNTSYYGAAQAVAAYANNPTLTGMFVSDTGANIGANLDGLEKLAEAGALASVMDSDNGLVPLTSQQFFSDSAVLSDLNYVGLELTSGPLLLSNGYLQTVFGGVEVSGTLTNTGTLGATASNGSLALIGVYSFPFGGLGEFANEGDLTIGNGYQLFLQTALQNTGSIAVSGGAVLAIDEGVFTNTGVITIDHATLQLNTELGIESLGSISNTGGIIEVNGELVGPGVLNVGSGSALGTVMLQGTIANATIVDGGGGLEFFGPQLAPGTGVLQNVTYDGTMGLDLHYDQVTVYGGLSLFGGNGTGPGTIQLTGSAARINLEQIGSLDNATVYIGSQFADAPSVLYAAGRALTLGGHLDIVQVQAAAVLTSDLGVGDGIVDDGAITAAVAGGQLIVRGADFTNNGSLLVGNGESVYLDTTQVGNIAGGTLSGGTWEVDGASTLWLPENSSITTLATTLTLGGSGYQTPTIEWFSTAAEADVTLQQTLATIGVGGALNLDGPWTFVSTSGGPNGLDVLGSVVLNGATLASTVLVAAHAALSGNGAVVGGAISDFGNITASGGLLDLAGALNGNGTLTVGNAATMELTYSDLAGITVKFVGPTGDLWLLAPSQTTISGFAAGDTVDLGNFIETGDSYNPQSHVLTITGTGGATVALTFLGSYTKGSFHFASDNNGGTLLTDPPAKTVATALASVANSPDLVGVGGVLPGGEAAAATLSTVSLDPLGGASATTDGVQVGSHNIYPGHF